MSRYSRMSWEEKQRTSEARVVLIETVFRNLRKQNILARANFSCCGSCAGYDLATQATKKNAKGWVTWNRQSEESIFDNGTVYVAYTGADACSVPPPAAVDTLTIAQAFIAELQKAGLRYEWDGTTERKILINLKAGVGTPLTLEEHLALTIGL